MSEYVRLVTKEGKTIRNDLYNPPPSIGSYIIFKKGDRTYVKNCRTGQIEFSHPDASTAINHAIQALPEPKGGMIFIKRGVYELTNQITIPNGKSIYLAGEGQARGITNGTTVLKQADNANLNRILSVESWSNTIRDLFIEGNIDNNTANTYGIVVVGGDNFLENIVVKRCHAGFLISGHAHTFINCAAEHCDTVGMLIRNADDCTFWHLHSEDSGTYGYWIYGNTRYNTFFGCKGSLNGWDGWLIEAYEDIPTRNAFIGCLARNNDRHGFHIKGAQRCILDSCIVVDNSQGANDTYDGVFLEAGTEGNSIRNIVKGCQIYNTAVTNKQRYGINEADASQDYNIYANNIVTDNVTGQMNIQGLNSIDDNNMTA